MKNVGVTKFTFALFYRIKAVHILIKIVSSIYIRINCHVIHDNTKITCLLLSLSYIIVKFERVFNNYCLRVNAILFKHLRTFLSKYIRQMHMEELCIDYERPEQVKAVCVWDSADTIMFP